MMVVLAELSTSVCLSEGPPSWGNIVGHHCVAITGCDLKGEALAIEIVVALPVLTPISGHWHPPGSGPFYGHTMHIPGTSYVCYQDQVEVGVTIYREPYATPSSAGHPTHTHTQIKLCCYHPNKCTQ